MGTSDFLDRLKTEYNKNITAHMVAQHIPSEVNEQLFGLLTGEVYLNAIKKILYLFKEKQTITERKKAMKAIIEQIRGFFESYFNERESIYENGEFVKLTPERKDKIVSDVIRRVNAYYNDTEKEAGQISDDRWGEYIKKTEDAIKYNKNKKAEAASAQAEISAEYQAMKQEVFSGYKAGIEASLHYACEKGDLSRVSRLLDGKSKEEIEAMLNVDMGGKPLELAEKNNHLYIVAWINEKRVNPSLTFSLHEACLSGDLKKLQRLLRKKASFFSKSKTYGLLPATLAAQQGHYHIVNYLLRKKGNIEFFTTNTQGLYGHWVEAVDKGNITHAAAILSAVPGKQRSRFLFNKRPTSASLENDNNEVASLAKFLVLAAKNDDLRSIKKVLRALPKKLRYQVVNYTHKENETVYQASLKHQQGKVTKYLRRYHGDRSKKRRYGLASFFGRGLFASRPQLRPTESADVRVDQIKGR